MRLESLAQQRDLFPMEGDIQKRPMTCRNKEATKKDNEKPLQAYKGGDPGKWGCP